MGFTKAGKSLKHSRSSMVLQPPYDGKTFLLEEYKALRREIEFQMAERSRIETQVYLGVFGILAWLTVNHEKLTGSFEKIGFGLPIALVALGFLRWIANQSRTMRIGKHIATVEPILRLNLGGGWENHLNELRSNQPMLGNPQGSSEIAGWIALLVITVAVYYMRFKAEVDLWLISTFKF